jgi:hypothetical protein
MEVVAPGLRLLRLVLLGGALGVLWLLLTATDSSAAPAGEGRGLPLVGQVPVGGDNTAAAAHQEVARLAAHARPKHQPTPKTFPRKVVRALTRPVEATASEDGQTTMRVTSTVVEAADSTTAALAPVPVLAPGAKPVVAEVVEPVLSTAKNLATTVRDVGGLVDDAVPSADVVRPSGPAEDGAPPAPPAAAAAASAAGSAVAGRAQAVAGAPGGSAPHGSEHVWPPGESEGALAADVAQRAPRDVPFDDVPAPPSPMGPAAGCAPGAGAGGGAQLDLAACRTAISLPHAATVPTGGSGHTASVPGPSVLPGFSPE